MPMIALKKKAMASLKKKNKLLAQSKKVEKIINTPL